MPGGFSALKKCWQGDAPGPGHRSRMPWTNEYPWRSTEAMKLAMCSSLATSGGLAFSTMKWLPDTWLSTLSRLRSRMTTIWPNMPG